MPLLRLNALLCSVRPLLGAVAIFAPAVEVARAVESPPPVAHEHEVKAAALYNIISFTDWPATAFSAPDAPLVIGILGQGPVADRLQLFVENETWHGRRLLLERYTTPEQAKNCHVLFVARSEQPRWNALRNQFAGRPVLTVCDAQNFARQGGIMQLGIERNKLKLTVNLTAARAAHLTISSKVLRLSEVVGN